MGRPRTYRHGESSLKRRVDPAFIDLYNELEGIGRVRSFPEFTRVVIDELKQTDLDKHLKNNLRLFK